MRRAAVAAAVCVLCLSGAARAQDAQPPGEGGDRAMALRWSIKGSGLFSWARQSSDQAGSAGPEGAAGDVAGAIGLWRARVEPMFRLGTRSSFEFAYEQRVRVFSSVGAAETVLPSEAAPPFRLAPLDWEIAAGAHAAWRHEIDRAVWSVALPGVDLAVGRQAIGWGRGVLFGAVDLFAPFSPLEADREWRRGVDAVRADARLTDRVSIQGVGVFGERSGASAYAARLRAQAQRIDLELISGWRAGDPFAGGASSVAVGPAEIHGELAAFSTAAAGGSVAFGRARTIIKAVVGGSTRIALGTGLLVSAEYHYSGFGAPQAGALAGYLSDPAFVARYLRGDTQILTRHAAALVAAYEWSPLVSATASWIHQPQDQSGVVSPALTLTFGDRLSLIATGYLGYGEEARAGALQSTYGSTPRSALVQVRFYH